MNKKFKNILILSAMLIVFVAVTFIFSSDRAIKHPDYTVYSANDKGAALLYDSLKILNFPVDISIMYIDEKTSVNDIHIIIAPNYNDFSEDRMKKISEWVMRGGNLIFLDNDNYFLSSSLESYFKNSEVYHTNTFSYYIYGAGKAYFSSALPITNKTLMDTPSNGEVIPEVISNMYYEKIYFNESYHGYAPSERLWDNIPFNIKLVAYEIIIITIVSVIYFGKRFGAVVPYFEETEREENEYVYTLSNLYLIVGMGEAIVNSYLDKFFAKSRRYFSIAQEPDFNDIIPLWEEYRLAGMDKLLYLSKNRKEAYNTKKIADRREFNKTIQYLKELIRILEKSKI